MKKKEKSAAVKKEYKLPKLRWVLLLYDLVVYFLVAYLLLFSQPALNHVSGISTGIAKKFLFLGAVAIFLCRLLLSVYRQIWRYGDIRAFFRLLLSDVIGGIAFFVVGRLYVSYKVSFTRALSIVATNLLCSFAMRMVYHFVYRYISNGRKGSKVLRTLLRIFTGVKIKADQRSASAIKNKIHIAIVGAGQVGVSLAEELLNNQQSLYAPRCFIETSSDKIGRLVLGIPVLAENNATKMDLQKYGVQEIVFAVPGMTVEEKQKLYEFYKDTGCKLKVYDYPKIQMAGDSKRHLREFNIEDLLFRQPVDFSNETTDAYYCGKTILITGGGGSIGSELCRQIAKMKPGKIVLLDVYENGCYDIQQELKIMYGNSLPLFVEIVSVCDKPGLESIFAKHRPDIVLHAAAHKHVPLMEHNCCEAVKNNVFGTLNTVEVAERFGVGRFIMVSTDKAVNPTNVMGATKRMCEMIVLSHSKNAGGMICSATRFGNVLGSAGSVIPLFKRQIANGGPVTITDKRIIRYFMTIPEASQLVLQSGRMAKNGELFVLDMGKPVKILDLAENMIRLSGLEPYQDIEIRETGLRPGEKLYEELLIRSEELDKTENNLIFIERDIPLSLEEIDAKLETLRRAVSTEDDEAVRAALHQVVPTFHTAESVNNAAVANGNIPAAVG